MVESEYKFCDLKPAYDSKNHTIFCGTQSISDNLFLVYSLFERRDIDLELLMLISKILDYDLLALYREDEKQQKNYIVLIETNELKIKELLSDNRIKIVKTWKASENSDIL